MIDMNDLLNIENKVDKFRQKRNRFFKYGDIDCFADITNPKCIAIRIYQEYEDMYDFENITMVYQNEIIKRPVKFDVKVDGVEYHNIKTLYHKCQFENYDGTYGDTLYDNQVEMIECGFAKLKTIITNQSYLITAYSNRSKSWKKIL